MPAPRAEVLHRADAGDHLHSFPAKMGNQPGANAIEQRVARGQHHDAAPGTGLNPRQQRRHIGPQREALAGEVGKLLEMTAAAHQRLGGGDCLARGRDQPLQPRRAHSHDRQHVSSRAIAASGRLLPVHSYQRNRTASQVGGC